MISIDTAKVGVAPGTTTIKIPATLGSVHTFTPQAAGVTLQAASTDNETALAAESLVRLQRRQLALQIVSTLAGVAVAAVGIWRLVTDRKRG